MTALPLHYVDNTILTNWKTCRLAGWLRYGLGYTRDGGGMGPKRSNLKMLFGTAAHEAVASWLVDQNMGVALAQFERAYKWAVHPIAPEDDRYGWENTKDTMAAWLYGQQGMTARPTFRPYHAWVESHLETRLTTDEEEKNLGYRIMFVSRPDALGEVDGLTGIYTQETKTTGSYISDPDWRAQWEKDSQLTSQIWTVARVTGRMPAGAMVNAIQVKKLPSGPQTCTRGKSAHHRPYNECRLAHAEFDFLGPFVRSDEALEKWRVDAVHAAEEFIYYQLTHTLDHTHLLPEDGAFKAGGACRFCEWRQWCGGGKDPGLVHGGAYDPWDPRLGAKGLKGGGR